MGWWAVWIEYGGGMKPRIVLSKRIAVSSTLLLMAAGFGVGFAACEPTITPEGIGTSPVAPTPDAAPDAGVDAAAK
jgi:hypothetical protein